MEDCAAQEKDIEAEEDEQYLVRHRELCCGRACVYAALMFFSASVGYVAYGDLLGPRTRDD